MFPLEIRHVWLLMALAIATGLALGKLRPLPENTTQLEWLAAPRLVSGFTLEAAGEEFSAVSLQGRWQLLALGFTHCADVCPLTLSQLVELRRATPKAELGLVFVSVDTFRDSPEQLADYVRYFGESITAVTGRESELRNLALGLGMDFRSTRAAGEVVISHSPTIAVLDPRGFLRGRLRPGFSVEQAARELHTKISWDQG